MPMVRPMSGFAAVLQTWPLGDSIGVRQQYPTLKQDTSDHLETPPQTGRFLFHLTVSPFTILPTRLCQT